MLPDILGGFALANRWADEPGTDDQPKSDLNPLLNPMLEENLGRWAQVYFTNPPEKRERAVMELLQELEDRASGKTPQAGGAQTGNGGGPTNGTDVEKVQCVICNRDNRRDQKFCGFCGAPLRAQQPASQSAAAPAAETMSFLGLSSTTPPENDLEFLREKSFEKAYYQPEPSRRRVLYILGALVIIVGGLGYFGWPILRPHLPPSWQPTAQARVVRAPQTQYPAGPPAETMPPQPLPTEAVSRTPLSPRAAMEKNPVKPVEPAKTTHPSSSASSSGGLSDSSVHPVTLASDTHPSQIAAEGNQELLLAQHYLHGNSTPANRAEAARLLWKSVSKQNPHAALLLADMYSRGDGVSKNCDQARVLLGAAAGKGVPDAAAKLRSLESNGCR
jgi:TPR repeat protein